MPPAQLLVEIAQGARRVVLRANQAELEPGFANTRFHIGYSKENDLMASFLQLVAESRERIQMSGAWKTDDADSCHCAGLRGKCQGIPACKDRGFHQN